MTLDTNPFPGPRPYTAEEKERFFGRKSVARRLQGTMLVQRCVTLYGPSGAGKSSLMQALILPEVERDERGYCTLFIDRWPEGQAPLEWLATRFHDQLALGPDRDPDPRCAITQAIERVDRPFFLYMDQLEQLLTRRTPKEVTALIECLDELVERPRQELHLVLGIREEDLGRWRDRIRGRRRLMENWLRLGPLTASEIIGAVRDAAQTGSPPQTWREADVRPLMREVREPGQPADSDDAEVQAAYAQIVCRTLFKEGALDVSSGTPSPQRILAAEPILQRYFLETMDELDRRTLGLKEAALRLLEEHFVDPGDGSRRRLTEPQALALARQLGVGSHDVVTILAVLNDAVVLHVYEHQGIRYYELGHDWLARRVFERGKTRRQREEQRRKLQRLAWLASAAMIVAVVVGALGLWAWGQRKEALTQKEKAEEAQTDALAQRDKAREATVVSGVREYMARGEPELAARLLSEVRRPEDARGWIEMAVELLNSAPFPVKLDGHLDWVRGASYSPDGQHVVTASDDHQVRVWRADGSDKDHPLVLKGHTGWVMTAAYSPDGQHIVSASGDRTARVWRADGSDKEHPLILEAHTRSLTSAAYSPDGQYIVTTSADVRVWKADGSGKDHPLVFGADPSGVNSAAYSLDGQRIVTASSDGTTRVWKADGSDKEHPLVVGRQLTRVNSAAFSPDGQRVVTASVEGAVRVWKADGSDIAHPLVLSGHISPVNSAIYSPDGRHIVSASDDRTVRVWRADGSDADNPLTLTGHTKPVTSASYSRDGLHIVTTSWDKTARVWRAGGPDGDGTLVSLARTEIHGAAYSPDGQHIVTAGSDGTARVWRADGSDKEHPRVLKGHASVVLSAAYSSDGQSIATASADGTVRVWRANGSDQDHPLILKVREPVTAASWSPDGQRVVTVSQDDTARVWKIDGSDVDHPLILKGHTDRVTFAAYSPDGEHIVTSSLDETVRVWKADGSDGDHPLTLRGHTAGVLFAAYSQDGQRIVSASMDETARVWSADGSHSDAPLVLKGHAGRVVSAAFSRDGKHVVTASSDTTARIWKSDGSDKDHPVVLKGHTAILTSAAYSPDGQHVVTASADATVRIWTFDISTLQRRLRAANPECLARDLRQSFLLETEAEAKDGYEACRRSLVPGALHP